MQLSHSEPATDIVGHVNRNKDADKQSRKEEVDAAKSRTHPILADGDSFKNH